MLKHLNVIFGSVAHAIIVVIGKRWIVQWPHECHELAGDDPVEITVLELLVVLVLLIVEIFEAIPSELHGELETLPAVAKGARVEAFTVARVTVRNDDPVEIRLEKLANAT